MRELDRQLELIRRGTAEIIVEGELRGKLERSLRTGVPLRVKLGLDPTAPDLHLGHTVVLQKMRQFQELGHQAIIIIGDFTGIIGDPTGKSETRNPLTRTEIEENAQTYRDQLGKILDMGGTRVEFNSTWLAPLTMEDVIRLTSTVTVAQMLQREDFSARYQAQRPISLHEFLYPICQAYDSVALQADVELGGTDQTFNLLVGRDLQRALGQEPQIALTVPILEGLDGVQKMSKSMGNYVGIAEPPPEIYGKLMSISDNLIIRYLTLVTTLPMEEVQRIEFGLKEGGVHPMEAKKRLARQVVAQYWGEEAAALAEAHFTRVHQEKELPGELPFRLLRCDGPTILTTRLITLAGLAPSNSEARRLMEQGGVRIDGKRVTVPQEHPVDREYLVQVGSRRFCRVQVTR